MEDEKLIEICNKIYAKHKRALDLIFEHRTDGQTLLADAIKATLTALTEEGIICAPPFTSANTNFLDEPDCRFHPEWSRNFIQSLRELLNTKTFREYRYQIIISTHSPLLVSDAVKDSIHCLHRNDDNNVSVQSSNYGLMSNLSDLFTDTFFSQSVFGAFAEQYANTLIKDINTAIQNPNSVTEDQIEEMRNRTYLIEDTVIRKSLDIMLRRVVYRRK